MMALGKIVYRRCPPPPPLAWPPPPDGREPPPLERLGALDRGALWGAL
jgi:hypothetical protein